MRPILICIATLLAVIDVSWVTYRYWLGRQNSEYFIGLPVGDEWWFQDGNTHIEDSNKVPVWDGANWTLNGSRLTSLAGEVGKRPLKNDDRCAFEYRLADNAKFGDFLSAQLQAEKAGASIMLATTPVDPLWRRDGQHSFYSIFYSIKHQKKCGA